jgi:hypothetical protein
MNDFKGNQFEQAVILWGVRWYVAYPIGYRQLEEMMQERGVAVDHSTLNRWVIQYARRWGNSSAAVSGRWGRVGRWMRPTCAAKASGNICIGPWTKRATRLIFC